MFHAADIAALKQLDSGLIELLVGKAQELNRVGTRLLDLVGTTADGRRA